MVDRREINKGDCIIVDLDGTLITGNSLKILTKFLFNQLLARHNFVELLKISLYIFIRKLKLIPHKMMKYKIIESAKFYLSKNELEKFTKILYNNRNKKVENLLRHYKNNGKTILLATAAPTFYLESFVSLFDYLDMKLIGSKLSTSYDNFVENNREEKLKSVEIFLKENNLNCEGVMTDHEDDLPLLLKYPKNIFLIRPSLKTIKIIDKCPQIHYKIIN